MKKYISILAMLFLFVGTAQAQTSHTVGITVEPFSYVTVSGDLSITVDPQTLFNMPGGGSGFGITGDHTTTSLNGYGNPTNTAFVDIGPVTVQWGTNSATAQQVRVKRDAGHNQVLYVPKTNVGPTIQKAPGSMGSAGSYTSSGSGYMATHYENIVTGITQAAGSMTFSYITQISRFEAPSTDVQTITYEITAN